MLRIITWAKALLFIHARMKPGRRNKTGQAKPASALAVLAGIRRAHKRMGRETAPLAMAAQLSHGMTRDFLAQYGPEALSIKRKEPEPAPPSTIDMTDIAPAARDFSALFGNGSIQAVLHVTKTDENLAESSRGRLSSPTPPPPRTALPARSAATRRRSRKCVGTWMISIHSHPCLRSSRHKHVHGP